jgi:hypothetical protein
MGINKRLSAGYGYAVAIGKAKGINDIIFNHVQRTVTFQFRPVAAATSDIARIRHFDPSSRIIGFGPGEPVKLFSVNFHALIFLIVPRNCFYNGSIFH